MNKEEIDKLFRRIELDKSNDSCGFEFADGFSCTFDNIATCYDDRLKLYDLVKYQQNNWNELKEYLKGFDLERLHETCEHNLADTIEVLLDKMQEIEGKNAQKRHEL